MGIVVRWFRGHGGGSGGQARLESGSLVRVGEDGSSRGRGREKKRSPWVFVGAPMNPDTYGRGGGQCRGQGRGGDGGGARRKMR